ncbi:MAG: hypothetical protein Q8O61_12900 [Nocardioides sp.]|nr:hypothetical protein [Nocardioides sp.]
MSTHQEAAEQRRVGAEPVGLTFWGTLGMVLAVLATATLFLVPWLA